MIPKNGVSRGIGSLEVMSFSRIRRDSLKDNTGESVWSFLGCEISMTPPSRMPNGSAIAVPQSATLTAIATIMFCIVLFIVVFLSLFAQATSRACAGLGRSP